MTKYIIAAMTAQFSTASVPAGSTWANLAWGFNAGGKDSISGRTYVDVDLFD